MPTYDYECDACGHTQEIFQNISEPVLEKCPQCKKKKFRRLFGAGAAVVFKGSGFYTTDYRSESYKKAASAESKPSDSSSSSGDSSTSKSESTKSESKPAASAKSESTSSTPSTTKPAKKD